MIKKIKIEKIKLRWESGFDTEEGAIYPAIYWLEIDGIKFPVKEKNVIEVGKKYAQNGQEPILTYRGPNARKACIELANKEELKKVSYVVLQEYFDEDGPFRNPEHIDSEFDNCLDASYRFDDIKENLNVWACADYLETQLAIYTYHFTTSEDLDCYWNYDSEHDDNLDNIILIRREYS